MSNQLFLVERYDYTGIPDRQERFPAPPPNVPLLFSVRVPADDVLLAVVEGPDEQTTSAALAAAGWRIDRITPASLAVSEELASSGELPSSEEFASDEVSPSNELPSPEEGESR